MPMRGNKGEWSEIYALLKILGEGLVYAGDEGLNKIAGLFYPIVRAILGKEKQRIEYSIISGDVVIESIESGEVFRIPQFRFLEKASEILKEIYSGEGVFAIKAADSFLSEVRCKSLKAGANDKSDIRIVLHDSKTGLDPELGFSIKSRLGAASTLLNASKATNILFRVVEEKCLSNDDVEAINGIVGSRNKVIKRIEALWAAGCELEFSRVENPTFAFNLAMLDSEMGKLVASLLLAQLHIQKSDFQSLVNYIAQYNPLSISGDRGQLANLYQYKCKQLLAAIALGMVPATPWDGYYEANGGYLVVREDGEVLCYHFFERNRFEDYLFVNAHLERSSTNRYDYAKLFRVGETLFFRLNLQIRLR